MHLVDTTNANYECQLRLVRYVEVANASRLTLQTHLLALPASVLAYIAFRAFKNLCSLRLCLLQHFTSL